MRYLITGATGFIGRELISQIQKNGDAFELITRNAKKAEEIFPDADEIHQIDLTNQVPKGNIFKDIWNDFLNGNCSIYQKLSLSIFTGNKVRKIIIISTPERLNHKFSVIHSAVISIYLYPNW